MTVAVTCPRCSDASRVTLEHIIQGGTSYRSCHCAGCGYEWEVAGTGAHTPSSGASKPDRSRSGSSSS